MPEIMCDNLEKKRSDTIVENILKLLGEDESNLRYVHSIRIKADRTIVVVKGEDCLLNNYDYITYHYNPTENVEKRRKELREIAEGICKKVFKANCKEALNDQENQKQNPSKCILEIYANPDDKKIREAKCEICHGIVGIKVKESSRPLNAGDNVEGKGYLKDIVAENLTPKKTEVKEGYEIINSDYMESVTEMVFPSEEDKEKFNRIKSV